MVDTKQLEQSKMDVVDGVKKIIANKTFENGGTPPFTAKRLGHYIYTVDLESISHSGYKHRYDTDGNLVIHKDGEIHYDYKLVYNDKGVKGTFLFN